MPEGIGNLFVGFGEGFGKSYFKQKQQKHEQEVDQESKQYKMMQDALHTASSRGDTNAIAHILRSMDDFSKVGVGTKQGKGSKGAKERGSVLTKFADMLEGGKPTEEASQAQSRQMEPNQTQESLSQETRPREAITKPLLLSNQQLSEQDNQAEVDKQKRLLPLKEQEQKSLIKARGEEQRLLDTQKSTERQSLFELQTKAKNEGDTEKLAYAYQKQYDISPEQARDMAGRAITELKEAKTSELKNRVKSRQDNFELHTKAFAESVKHHRALEERAIEASQRGDKSLAERIATRLKASGSKELISSMGADLQQMSKVQSEINRLETIVSDPLKKNDPQVQGYKDNLKDLDKQYSDLRENVQKKQGRLDTISNDLEEKRLSSTPSNNQTTKKSLTKKERSYKIIRKKEDGKQYKFYGYKPDGSPDLEPVSP